jgi:signal transduction histidine kinase
MDKLLLTVEDSGAGFDMKNANYILEAFNRLTPTYKSQDKGLGIGLTIVQTFLQELNGCLNISSQKGKGSCFECSLPIKQK